MKYKAPYGSVDANAAYVDKDVPGAIAGSKVPSQAIENPMRELDSLILKSGLTPSHADLTQVLQAIRSQKLNYIAAGGTANALTATLDPALLAYTAGLPMRVMTGGAVNTAAMTLNVNGLGVKNILRRDGAALQAGDVPASVILDLVYDGAAFRLKGIVPSEVNLTIFNNIRTYDCDMTNGQSIPNNVMTNALVNAPNTNELLDSTIAATAKVTVGTKDAGLWIFTSYTQYAGVGTKSLRLHKNGVATSYSALSRIAISQNTSGGVNDAYNVTSALRLNAGDIMTADFLQATGASVTMTLGRFTGIRIAP